ncbi:hypothetical protein KA183_19055 [bacterium]|nr:hypothetical protein [bacterium]
MQPDELKQLKPIVFTTYLAQNGWLIRDFDHKGLVVFDGHSDDSGKTITLVLSKDLNSDEYAGRIWSACRTLSLLRKTKPELVFWEMVNSTSDTLKVKVEGRDQYSIPFDTANDVIANLRTIFLQGGLNQLNPKPFQNKTPAYANTFLRKCRFEQTFKGSFGFRISVEIFEDEEQEFDAFVEKEKPQLHLRTAVPGIPSNLADEIDDRPFERRVMQRIYRGVKTAKAASEENSVFMLTQHYEDGLNANMCLALSTMLKKNKDVDISWKVDWSPLYKPTDLSFNEPVVLSSKAAPVLISAYKAMAVSKPADETTTFIGIPTKLEWTDRRSTTDDATTERVIELRGEIKGKAEIVRVYLSFGDYEKACAASGKQQSCSIMGTLVQRHGKWYLMDPHNFKLSNRTDPNSI